MPEEPKQVDTRVQALNEARDSYRRPKPVDLTPDEARALIDGVFRAYGLDPAQATDSYGWRYLSLGSVDGLAGVVEWQPDDYYLVIAAPILDLPQEDQGLAGFYRLLLELNHDGTLAARFSIHNDMVYVGLTRPIRGLDGEEVDDAIYAVMSIADSYDEWLADLLNQAPPRIDLDKLPNIRMTPQEVQVIGTILSFCDPHGQDIFRYLMEWWHDWGYIVDPATTGIGFKFSIDSNLYSMCGIRPGVGERRQLILLSWEGLRKRHLFPKEAIDRFQSTVLQIAEIEPTETTAHIEVTEAFDRECARALLEAMRELVQTAHPPGPAGVKEPAEGES